METHIIPVPEGPGKVRLLDMIDKGLVPTPNLFSGPWIAGGAVRRLMLGQDLIDADIDVFRSTDSKRDAYLSELDKVGLSKFVTEMATTYKMKHGDDIQKVQVITGRLHNTVETLLDDFDFTVCQFATDGNYIVYLNTAKDDLENGILRKSENARKNNPGILKRFIKYANYGYQAVAGLMPYVMNAEATKHFKSSSVGIASVSQAPDPFYDPDDSDERRWIKLKNHPEYVLVDDEFAKVAF